MLANRTHWVMDYETLPNCFVACFEDYKTDTVNTFIVSKLINQFDSFLSFINRNIKNYEWHFSFNGLAFDAQVTQYIVLNAWSLRKLNGETIARKIYEFVQTYLITTERKFPPYREYDLIIKQIDLFKLNHWDNPAKSSSLKWIQTQMDWKNVQDMPIHHSTYITTIDQINTIVSYCLNDVKSTKEIMILSKKEISLRNKLSVDYNTNLHSASEPKISKEIFLYFLSKEMNVKKADLRLLRTKRDIIIVKDLLLPYIKFNKPEFVELYNKFKAIRINPEMMKGVFKCNLKYKGVETNFGFGGVHGAKKGIYESDEYMVIMTSDVVSYYPNLAIRNEWSPAHLPKEIFCKLYEWFFNERKKIPKTDIRNYVYKIILNSTYGLSNDKDSFLYDPQMTMQITMNGQLLLMMLYEMIDSKIPGAIPIMQNTDGLEFMIPRQYINTYLDVCKEWEDMTKLTLEHDQYQKMIVPDVNNYIAVYNEIELSLKDWLKYQTTHPENVFTKHDGKFFMAKSKCKGRFVFKDRPLHKNKSFTVVSKALYYYFIHDMDIKEYINSNTNIFDFCGYVKAKGSWTFKEQYVDNEQEYQCNELQKTLRYFITNKGSKILKTHKTDGRIQQVEAGKSLQTVFNLFIDKPFDEYDINKQFYLYKIESEIRSLKPDTFNKQLVLNF